MSRADAVVIGAGVIGSAVALELARGGRAVVVVDKGPGAGAGSTSASSAIIRYSYSTRDAILTAWEAAQMWFDWTGHLGCVDPDGMAAFVECPNLIFQTTGYDGSAILPWWDRFGIPYEILDAAALRDRFPMMDSGKFHPPKLIDDPAFADDPVGELTAIYNPNTGFMDDPTLAARNLAYAARQHGAEFRFRAQVVSIARDDRAVSGVTLASGEVVDAPVVVNVAGPYSSGINRMAGVTDDMRISHRPLRQEVFVAPVPEGLRLEDGSPIVSDLDIGQYFRPQPGGTMLIGGAEPECDELHWIDDPDSSSEYPTVEIWETAMMRFARRVPAFGVPSAPSGLGALYDASDDWVPIYDRSSLHGFFMACGSSGNQFKNAPIAGQYMRDIVDATMDGHDHDADPVRFRGPHTGELIDLGAFSRRREPAHTSGTVMG
jgi:glycine/D-amino acid oxidase-like deaminating enzyme